MANDLEQMGFVIDVTKYTFGDILDLSDESIPITQRLMVLSHGLVKGNIRELPITKLADFVQAINDAVSAQANPT